MNITRQPTTPFLLGEQLYLACIKGTSETIARILQPYDIRVAYKPATTLQHILTNVKDKDQRCDRQETVYRMKCTDCQATSIGENGRNMNIRLTEQKKSHKER